MKTRMALLVVGLLWAGSAADAGWLHSEPKLPKAVDSPVVRPKLSYDHTYGHYVMHGPAKYYDPLWGKHRKLLMKMDAMHMNHSVIPY